MTKEYIFMKDINMLETDAMTKMLNKFILETNAPKQYEVKFVKKQLSNDDIQRIADRYSSDYGTYYFHGKQYEFNELLEIIKENWFYIRMFVEWEEEI